MVTPLQVTFAPYNHIISHRNLFSSSGAWIVYDVRSSPTGDIFDGDRIERVNVETGEVQVLYRGTNGANVGVATCHPSAERIVFIEGPQHPTADWSYGPSHRQGIVLDISSGVATPLDARDLTPPYTPGSLRGGTHLHLFDGAGEWVSFTYDDAIAPGAGRNVGVSVPGRSVKVPRSHERNRDGDWFSALVTHIHREPIPGSDQISRAAEEAWVGLDGYLRPDGSRQKRAIAFQGQVRSPSGQPMLEVFIVDLPEMLRTPSPGAPAFGSEAQARRGEGGGKGHFEHRTTLDVRNHPQTVPEPLEDRAREPDENHSNTHALSELPAPPPGCIQRRLTFTASDPHPGIQGPRHWLVSSPAGSRIAFLRRDGDHADLYTVSPNGGPIQRITRTAVGVSSPFTWSPSGDAIAYLSGGSVWVVGVHSGQMHQLTPPETDLIDIACVFSPDGKHVAYLRQTPSPAGRFNQIFIVPSPRNL